LSLRRLYCWVR